MTASRMACPKCGAAIKSSKKIPAGTQVQCPRCRHSFPVPADEIVAARPGPDPAMGIIVADNKSGQQTQTAAAVAEQSATGQSKRALIVILAIAALVLTCTGLVVYHFFHEGSGKSGEPQADLQIPEPDFKPVPPRPLISLTKEEQDKVNKTVARGVEYLKKTQTVDGAWPGPRPVEYAALGGMTLLECGVLADDSSVKKAADYVRKQSPTINNTYGISLYVLFLNKLNDPQDKERITELALRLVAGQSIQGGWNYNCPVLPPTDQVKLLSYLQSLGSRTYADLKKELPARIKALPTSLQQLPVPADPDAKPPSGDFYRHGGDNSNTQFALLALWAAKTRKLAVDRSLALVVRRFRHSQNADGSWNYSGTTNASPLPTMTCAGLLGLAVGYGLDTIPAGQKSPDRDPSIQNAVLHLSKSIGGRSKPSPKPAMVDMYFLWSAERVGVLFQFKKIGDKDWYHWGMDILQANQAADGSWHGGGSHGTSHVVDSCFALLFLQRANLAKDLTDKIQELFASVTARLPSATTEGLGQW